MDNATGISPASLASQLGTFPPSQLVDVRRQSAVATPCDIPDVAHSHFGAQCSFDAFVRIHDLHDPALDRLARGADTDDLALAAQAPGHLAIFLGLSAMITNGAAMLRGGLLVDDALCTWCRTASGARHGWNPAALRA